MSENGGKSLTNKTYTAFTDSSDFWFVCENSEMSRPADNRDWICIIAKDSSGDNGELTAKTIAKLLSKGN